MKTRVMVDLETFGQRPGSVIVSIGAVKFGDGQIISEFYARVDAQSCVDVGLKLDVSTVFWWLMQSEAARLELTKPALPLSQALAQLSAWIGDGDAEVWGNGASFDNALLVAAFFAVGLTPPWKFWNDRCYRTMKATRPDVRLVRTGTHHNALEDAKSQALHLMQIEAA
jgi:DNA polymerase III epsilon subunit-like protein